MTRTRDSEHEAKMASREKRAGASLRIGLQAAVEAQGGTLAGFSVRCSDYESFMTLRVDFDGKRMIAFVGSETLEGVFIKAEREAAANRLKWKVDRYAE